MERAKETGIIKVAGAQKSQRIIQSLVESTLINLISISIALILVVIFLPLYNSTTGKELSFELINITSILPYFLLVLFGIIVAGIYPALLLSSYAPVKALKGKIQTSSQGLNIRKGLIITQFSATIILLIGTIVVTK